VGPWDIGWRGADISHQIGWPYGIPRIPYWFARWFWRSQAIGRTDLPEEKRIEMLRKESKNMPESDRDVYDDEDFWRLVIRSTGQAFAQGYDYVWDDGVVSCSDFGFKVEEIRKDLPVQLWYGKKDVFVPPIHGVQIAARLGDSAHLRLEDETHTGILMHWKREIFEAIAKSM
jgi:pimeloyl-ACP methyl ester carboxylesterase